MESDGLNSCGRLCFFIFPPFVFGGNEATSDCSMYHAWNFFSTHHLLHPSNRRPNDQNLWASLCFRRVSGLSTCLLSCGWNCESTCARTASHLYMQALQEMLICFLCVTEHAVLW